MVLEQQFVVFALLVKLGYRLGTMTAIEYCSINTIGCVQHREITFKIF